MDKKEEYAEYLKSEHWISFSKRIKKERKKCEKCGNNKSLNVHHLTYANKGKEKDEDVIVLCRLCHKIIHGIEIKKKHKFSKSEKKRLRELNLCRKCGKNKIFIKEYFPFCKFCYIRKQKHRAERKLIKLKKKLSMGKNAKWFIKTIEKKQIIFDLPLEEKLKIIKQKKWLV